VTAGPQPDIARAGEVHFFFGAVVAALGFPRWRPLGIGIVIIVVPFVVVHH
jgi:hypothetical protein